MRMLILRSRFASTSSASASATDEAHSVADEMLEDFFRFRLLREEGEEAAEAEMREIGESEEFGEFLLDAR